MSISRNNTVILLKANEASLIKKYTVAKVLKTNGNTAIVSYGKNMQFVTRYPIKAMQLLTKGKGWKKSNHTFYAWGQPRNASIEKKILDKMTTFSKSGGLTRIAYEKGKNGEWRTLLNSRTTKNTHIPKEVLNEQHRIGEALLDRAADDPRDFNSNLPILSFFYNPPRDKAPKVDTYKWHFDGFYRRPHNFHILRYLHASPGSSLEFRGPSSTSRESYPTTSGVILGFDTTKGVHRAQNVNNQQSGRMIVSHMFPLKINRFKSLPNYIRFSQKAQNVRNKSFPLNADEPKKKNAYGDHWRNTNINVIKQRWKNAKQPTTS